MYFNFEDYRPDTPTLPRSLTRLEVCLLTIVVYLSMVILLLVWPKLPFVQQWEIERQQALAKQQEIEMARQRDQARFVFMAPRVDLQAPKPPPRAELSDLDRKAQTVERAEKPTNPMPFSRGNTVERMEGAPPAPEQKGSDAAPPQQQAANDQRQGLTLPDAPNAREPRAVEVPQPRGPSAGVLADAIRNVQKYAPRDSYVNLQGGADQNVGPSIQFDSKGVEFGPWLRRFIAQIRRNWIIPQAAMMLKGHVSITFFVDKATGRISELKVLRPSDIDAFNNSSYGALAASNPTYPLPPEYPDDRAFFTVTFYYNENPDR
jgi:hypothetical protein